MIIKLIGKTVGYNFLAHIVHALWRIQSLIDVIDAGNDTYFVRFTSIVEYECAFYDGPWIIADHYLSVGKCEGMSNQKYVKF